MIYRRHRFLNVLLNAVMVFWVLSAEAAGIDPNGVVAEVGGRKILVSEYRWELLDQRRSRFYHGMPPEGELEAFQEEVLELLIERHVLIAEADRQGVAYDEGAVRKAMESNRRKFADRISGKDAAEVFAFLEAREIGDAKVRAMRDRLSAVEPAADAQIRTYYEANPEKFTQPARDRLSIIMLSVAPYEPRATWQAAQEKAAELVSKIRSGEDFEELAQAYSQDPSAAAGGDLGYVHGGRLGENVEPVVKALEVGEVADPIKVLEGVVVVKLTHRIPATLMEFDLVRERAQELWMREETQAALDAKLKALRQAANVVINTKLLSQLNGRDD